MKRRELIRHLTTQGCVLIREGGSHSWWGNRGESAFSRAASHGNQQFSRPENLPGFRDCRAMIRASKTSKDSVIVVNLYGRGDKDVAQVAAKVGLQMPK